MDRRRAAGALLALAACIACSTAAPTASNQTALELLEGPSEGCYYNFQHYGEGDRIMTNEPCLNCTCHNRMLMCYLKVCPFTKPIGQDCTIEKRGDQCCPIVTCPDVPVDLLTSTSTSSPAEYGATGLGKVDKYGCSINGKYFSEGSKVPPTPNKPCEHCYCIRNMTTCVMQECTLHVDGCTPIYHKDVCCPVRYSCDHQEDEMLLLDDMTTTVRPTPGFLLTTTTMPAVTQMSQDCVHDDQIFVDGALIKTEKACEHCYCMKGDIVCVVQECGTPMENEGKNCTSLPPRQGQCCPDTYICEGDELTTDVTTEKLLEDMSTLSPPRKTEGSGYRNEPDEPYTDLPIFEGSGEEQATTLDTSGLYTSHKQTTEIIDEVYTPTEESLKPSVSTIEPDKGQNTVPDVLDDSTSDSHLPVKTTQSQEFITGTQPSIIDETKETDITISKTTTSDYHSPTEADSFISKEDELIMTTKSAPDSYTDGIKITTEYPEIVKETTSFDNIEKLTTPQILEPSTSEYSTLHEQKDKATTPQSSDVTDVHETLQTTSVPKDDSDYEHDDKHKQDQDTSLTPEDAGNAETPTTSKTESYETTSINPVENEIHEDVTPILPPGRIPGEGDCLLNGITYKNNTNVPNINNCHSSCKCVSSIVKCDPIICSPPPAEHMENMSDCQPIYDTPDACCPTYVCHSRETIPPESHSQMSGTESPKPSPEKPEIECHGDECKSEVTASMSPETEQELKDCKNGVCIEQTESSSEVSVSSDHPVSCTGDSCSPSKETCTDGKCEQPTTSEHICDNENGCQPSEAEPCEGNNCGTEIGVPKDETPICEDPEGCKVSDTPKVSKPEEGIKAECTEEGCKRKEEEQKEHKPPSECSGSDCITQETTDSILKDQSSKESTTETIEQGSSKSPELDESQKATQTERQQTEKQDISPEYSTEKYEVMTQYDADDHVTEKEEAYTTKIHITKEEEAVTEQYKEPESEDRESYPTKSEEQATESFEQTVKEMSTDLPAITQYEEHPTELPKGEKEDVSTAPKVTEISPTVDKETSTEISHVEPHDEDKQYTTETAKVEESTEKLDTPTEPSNEFVTLDKETETELSEEGYTKKQEIVTEKPETFTTHLDETMPSDTEKQEPTGTISQEDENTQSDLEVTQPSVPVSHEEATESYIKEDDATGSLTTQQSILLEETSVSGETKVEEMVTDKTYDHPNIVTETAQSEVTEYEPYVTEKGPLHPETTHTLPESEDTEATKSSIKDEEEYGSTHKMPETIPDVQNINTTPKETQEYVTSSINIETLATESITEGEHEVHHPVTEKVDTSLPETPIEESTNKSEDLDLNDSSTQYPEKAVTGLQDSTTKTLDETKIPSATLETLEENTYTAIHDFSEISTKMPETPHEESTTQKETSGLESEMGEFTSSPLAKETVSGTQETGTKSSESHVSSDYSPDTTLRPEIISTKLDESIPTQDEIVMETSQPLTTRRDGSETGTTESLKQPDEETTDIPEKTHITESAISEQTKDEMTESSKTPTSEDNTYTDKTQDSDKENVPVIVDDNKTEGTPVFSSTVSYESEQPDHHVTETTDFDIKGTYSDEKIQTPTEYPVLHEPQSQKTQVPEIVTQEPATKSPDLQTEEEIFTQSTHAIKEGEKQTESPMSLVTEKGEHITLRPIDAVSDSEVDKATQAPHVTISEPHETKPEKPDTDDTMKETHETEPEKPYTETSEKDYGSETSSPVYTEKEGLPENAPEYTTAKVLDIHDEEKTKSTITDEKLSPTTEFTPIPTKTESEVSAVDVSDESSTDLPHLGTSEESFVTKLLETTTKSIEISPTTTVTFDQGSEIIPHDKPIEEHATKIIEDDFESTTVSKITESLEEDTRVTVKEQQPEQHTKVTGLTEEQDKYTTSPELFTTKYPESFDHEKDTAIPEHETTKQEDSVVHEYITTEGPISQASESPSSTVILDYEKPTEVSQSPDAEKDKATPTDQDLTTLKEAPMVPETLTTAPGILTTESSDTTFIDEGHRRTLSPKETVEPELITEGQKIPSMEQVTTARPDVINIPEVEHPVTEEQSESEGIDKHTSLEHVTPDSHVTEAEIIHTPSHEDQDIPVITETIDKDSTGIQDETTKRTYTEPEDNKNLQTELPMTVTEQSAIPERTTGDEDVKTPEEVPSDHTAPQKSETESSVPKVTEPSVPETMDTSLPEATEASIPEVTETEVHEVTEAAEPEGTKASEEDFTRGEVPDVTKVSGEDVTEAEASKVTKTPEQEITEANAPEVTKPDIHEVSDAEVPEVTRAPIQEVTKGEIPEITKVPIHEVTNAEAPEETKAPGHEATDVEIPEVTEATSHEVTDAETPEVTKTPIHDITDAELPEITKSPLHEVTDAEIPEETKAPVHEVADTEAPEETKEPVHEVTEAETPEVTKAPLYDVTEAEIPEITKSPVHEVIDVETHEETKAPVDKVTEAEAPEVTKAPVGEVTDAETSEVTKAPVHEVGDAEVPNVTKAPIYEATEGEAPEETKAPVHEVTEAEAPEETKAPVYEATEAEGVEVTKAPVHEVTEPEASEETKAPVFDTTGTEAPEETKSPVHEVIDVEVPEVTKAPIHEGTDAEAPEVTKGPEYEATKAEAPEVTKGPVYEATEAEAPEVTKAPSQEVTDAEVSEVTKSSVSDVSGISEPEITEITVPKVTEVPVPEVTEAAVPEGTEASIPKGTEVPVPEESETSVPKETEASVPEVTELSVPDVTESSTYQPKDEKSEIPPEPSPTSESTYSSSETTEYLVELEEHKYDQGTSSVAPVDKYTTRGPEIYQTERGDQPLDTVTDKSTQEVQEQYTTKVPIIEKDDKLSTPSQEQPSEYSTKSTVDEEIHHETELTTEKVSISSESPAPAVTESIHTMSEAQGSTILPTETVPFSEHDKQTTVGMADEKHPILETEKVPEPTEQTTDLEDELIPTITKATTAKIIEETTTHLPIHDDKIKPEEKPVESHQTTAPESPKPAEMQPTEEIPSPDFPQGGTSGYGQEPDYVEEDQAFGPGTCRYGGKVYVSAQQIPRDDPCDFCFCFRSDIICLQQSCPPPIHGCHEEPIQGFCCPRYECPVSMATTLNVTTTTTTTTTTLPPHFFPHAYKGAAQRRGCQIKGHTYKVGEVVRASSGPCLHCTCGGDGQMKCDPKACTPEPMLRQMIAAAVSAKRRR